jgi:hypothetical protein
LRDVQVLEKRLQQRELPDVHDPRRWRRDLKSQEKTLRRATRSAIRPRSLRKRGREFLKIEFKLAHHLAALEGDDRSLLANLRASLRRQRVRLHHKVGDLRLKDAKAFHKLRVSVKNCDDRLEIVDRILPVRPEFKMKMRQLKDRLGEMQDEVALLKNAGHHLQRGAEQDRRRRLLKLQARAAASAREIL